MSGPTPGPWVADVDDVYSHNGEILVCERPRIQFARSRAAWPYNARLIAAAPDLLAALVALSSNPCLALDDMVYRVRDLEGEGWDGPAVKAWSDAVEASKAAIAKATGGAA